MKSYPRSIERLVENLKKIPGVGAKSAERIAFFFVYAEKDYINDFKEALGGVKSDLYFCTRCFSLTENIGECDICTSSFRDKKTLCVVENFRDQAVFEELGEYNGLYHVLQGKLSPLDGITLDKIRIQELLERVENEPIKEIIMATSLDVEGDATAYYVRKKLDGKDLIITRLAKGLPVGVEIEFADTLSLANSLRNRERL